MEHQAFQGIAWSILTLKIKQDRNSGNSVFSYKAVHASKWCNSMLQFVLPQQPELPILSDPIQCQKYQQNKCPKTIICLQGLAHKFVPVEQVAGTVSSESLDHLLTKVGGLVVVSFMSKIMGAAGADSITCCSLMWNEYQAWVA